MSATPIHGTVAHGFQGVADAFEANFAEHGDIGAAVCVFQRWVLSHEAGLAAVTGEVTMDDVLGWEGVVGAIAAQAPVWEPGTTHGYHARSYGWILGEVVRRATGRSLGRYFADEIAGPLDLDFFIGLPRRELGRVARLYPPVIDPEAAEALDAFLGPDTMLGQVGAGLRDEPDAARPHRRCP